MTDKKIIFEGIEFTVPSESKHLPVKVLEAWEDDKVITFVRSLMGPEAWEKFTARDPVMDDFSRLATKIGQVYGFESAGESSGSGTSSKSTAEPSPQTSPTSTDSDFLQSVNAP